MLEIELKPLELLPKSLGSQFMLRHSRSPHPPAFEVFPSQLPSLMTKIIFPISYISKLKNSKKKTSSEILTEN